ncbi:hypothetical protein [Pseudomonas orientalis]|uniref:hypothetical protein n=1 Tax=Pseudomonas orientalis TaxID=76758 RepID=UPI0018D29CE9|nr:hypothetical protein [Pseudomonas orientalis]
MSNEICYGFVCFFSLDPNGPKIFGLSEFLAGLALMVLAWTTADVLYRFRIAAAPWPLRIITFYIVAVVGILTLLTDLWRAEGWYVIKGSILSPPFWQAILGGVYIATFLSWAWYAFIKPPVFSRKNARHYASALYRVILKGSVAELSVISDELSFSAKNLITYATNFNKYGGKPEKTIQKKPEEAYADILLLLIADKKFCRAIVQSAPGTALSFFEEIGKQKKYGVQVEAFAKNIVFEAIANKDSFLYHEGNGYESGLLGYHKPLSQAMFSDSALVDGVGTLLNPDPLGQWKWEAYKWEVYSRIVLMVFEDKVHKDFWGQSSALSEALRHIGEAVSGLYQINGAEKYIRGECEQEKLRIVVDFISDTVRILDEKGVPEFLPMKTSSLRQGETIYDEVARLAFAVILNAAKIKSPATLCWMVQYNAVWGELAGYKFSGSAGKIVQYKLRRLLYDEMENMSKFPNYKSALIFGFLLNVVAFFPKGSVVGHEKILKKLTRGWLKKNYASLRIHNPTVADACLVDGITYDVDKFRLVKVYSVNALRKKPRFVYLQLDSPRPSFDII